MMICVKSRVKVLFRLWTTRHKKGRKMLGFDTPFCKNLMQGAAPHPAGAPAQGAPLVRASRALSDLLSANLPSIAKATRAGCRPRRQSFSPMGKHRYSTALKLKQSRRQLELARCGMRHAGAGARGRTRTGTAAGGPGGWEQQQGVRVSHSVQVCGRGSRDPGCGSWTLEVFV